MKEPSEKKAIIKKMMKEGKTYKQISEETGLSYSTISIYAGQIRRKEREVHSFNGDRHLCMTCKYRASDARKGCEKFHRPAYQAGNLIKVQGQQLWHGDVTGYIARKYKIGSDTIGDNDEGKAGSIPE